MIIKIQHIGLVVTDLKQAAADYEKLFGMTCVDWRDNGAKELQYDARIMLPNECWLHLVQNGNPESHAYGFYKNHGENLEHLALETDDIKTNVEHLRTIGVPIFEDTIFDTTDGFAAFVLPDDAIGFTVELIQPHESSHGFEPKKCSNPNILGLQHIGVAVKDMTYAVERFEQLFDIRAIDLREDQHYGTQKDMMIDFDNDRLWLHLVETTDPENRVYQFMEQHGQGLEHLAIEVDDIREAVKMVQSAGIPLFQHKIYLDREDGFEAFVYPEYNHGVTVELIEPYEDSRGYRPLETR